MYLLNRNASDLHLERSDAFRQVTTSVNVWGLTEGMGHNVFS